jgi:hypothetical protein
MAPVTLPTLPEILPVRLNVCEAAEGVAGFVLGRAEIALRIPALFGAV